MSLMVSFGYYDPEHHGAICRETYGPRTTCYRNALVDLVAPVIDHDGNF